MGDVEITRRRLVGGAAGAAGMALAGPLGTPAAEARRRRPRRRKLSADVAVVGAGLSGLFAARELVRAGRSVIVLEARDRVGGRTLNRHLGGGHVVEEGGQWVGPTNRRMERLAKELGVEQFKTYNSGENVYLRDGTKLRYGSEGPFGAVPPDPALPELVAGITQLNQMAAGIKRAAPWESPGAADHDSMSLETWIVQNVHTEGGRKLFRTAVESVRGCSARDVSLLSFLAYIAGGGDDDTPGTINSWIGVTGGELERRFVGGSHLISQRLAEQLGRRVVLNAPVRRIDQTGRRVTVEADRVTVRATRVIVTVPPALAGQIAYAPALPIDRAQLQQRYPQGSVIKCLAVYDEPWWRADGLTGQAVSDTPPVKVTFDNSPPDGRPGILVGFIVGTAAREWGKRQPAARREAVLANFASYFGERAASPVNYFDRDWSAEAWTRGCYTAFSGPGVLLDYGPALRAPVERIHWGGTETAVYYAGSMEGAIDAGGRVATEVAARL